MLVSLSPGEKKQQRFTRLALPHVRYAVPPAATNLLLLPGYDMIRGALDGRLTGGTTHVGSSAVIIADGYFCCHSCPHI